MQRRSGSAGARAGGRCWRRSRSSLSRMLVQLVRPAASGVEAADVAHDQEHGVLHRRVGDACGSSTAARRAGCRGSARRAAACAVDHRLAVVRPQRRQQQHVLQGEAVLGVVEHALQARQRALARRLDQPQVLAAVEVEVAVDEAEEVVALREARRCRGIAHPAVELGADAVEVLGLRALLALADLGGVLAAQPGLEAVGLDLLASLVEFADAVAPAVVGVRCAWPSSMLASR